MGKTLEFQPVTAVVNLPENYMPAGLSALRGEAEASARLLLQLHSWEDEIDFSTVTATEIGDLEHWEAPSAGPKAPEAMFYLGQPVRTAARRRPAKLASRPTTLPVEGGNGRSAVVIIDHGIAFWNHRFRLGAAPVARTRFQEVQFLTFDEPGADDYQVTTLTKAQLDGFCAQADAPGGERQVRHALRALVPGSFYGSGADAQGLWHGTAIADLAAGAAPDTADDRMLFGLELPTSALRDWGGDTLQTLLMTALSAALKMVEPLLAPGSGCKSVVFVLAFGFPAGPQDGSHPAADLIRNFLSSLKARAGEGGPDLQLVLPAGNHLQDQCHARLPALAPGAARPSVTWRVAPDDYSPNTLEICLKTQTTPEVELVAPDGMTASAILPAGGFARLVRGGVVIGGLQRLQDRAGWAKLRLSLARTAWRDQGPAPAPFGDWTLRVAADVEAEVWALRDDRDVVSDAATPHRPSVLVDPAYRREDATGAPVLDDRKAGVVRREGTASVLTTSGQPEAQSVAAVVANPQGGQISASYSSLPRTAANGFAARVQIGDDQFREGVICVANGSAQEVRILGTSAAAALHARALARL